MVESTHFFLKNDEKNKKNNFSKFVGITTLSDRMVSDFFLPPWIRLGESFFFHFPDPGPLLIIGHLIPLN